MHTIQGNKVQLLYDGRLFYDALLADIRAAEHSILMEFFIFREDAISMAIMDALAERARSGVQVCVLLDYFGCLQHFEEKRWWRPMKSAFVRKYRDSGVDLAFWRRKLFFPRNHRKLTLIDGKVAYTGGMNVSEMYRRGGCLDMHLRIEGPAAAAFHAGFARMWSSCRKLPPGAPGSAPPAPCGDVSLAVLESPLPGARLVAEELYCQLIASARESIRMITPYFWPTGPIRRGLRAAARRGVRVELMMGAESDLPLSILTFILFSTARRLARKGCFTLHLEPGCFHHDKVLSVDGRLAVIGSYNLDFFSLRVNHELGVLIDDPAVARELDRYFDEHAHSEG